MTIESSGYTQSHRIKLKPHMHFIPCESVLSVAICVHLWQKALNPRISKHMNKSATRICQHRADLI